MICDTLEEAIKELRKQLRKKEKLEMELKYHKQMVRLGAEIFAHKKFNP